MRSSRQLAVAVTATLVTAGGAVGIAGATGSLTGDGPGQRVAHQTGDRDGRATGSPEPSAHPVVSAGSGSARGASQVRKPQNPGAAATEPVGEVMAAGADASGGLPGLPVPPSAAPAVVGWPLPHASNAHGAVVAGYPAVLRPVSGSRVLSSSVSPEGRRLQAALRAVDRHGAAGVLAAYRQRLSLAGFDEVPTTAIGGADAAAFRRGLSSVVVTVAPGRSGSYDVFASLRAGKGE